MTRRQKIRAAMFVVLAMIASMIAVIPAAPAMAAVTEVASLTDIYAEQIYTHGNGMLTATSQCRASYQYKSSAKTLDSLGNTSTQLGWPVGTSASPYLMCPTSAVGPDGTIYAIKRAGDYYSYFTAHKNNVQLWQTVYDTTPCNSKHQIGGVVIGADGNIYLHTTASCASEPAALISVNPTTGSIRFKRVLTTYSADNSYTRISAHQGGIVVFDKPSLRYFDYSGNEDTVKTYAFGALPSGQSLQSIAFNAAGDTFFTVLQARVSGSPDPCTANQYHAKYVLVRRFDNTTQDYNTAPLCMGVGYETVATPNGGLVFRGWQNTTNSDRLAILKADGSVTQVILPMTGLNPYQGVLHYRSQVDLNGNIVLARTAYKNSGDLDRVLQVLVLDTNGNLTFTFSSDEIGTSSREYFSTEYRAIGIEQGRLHIPICKNNFDVYTCSPTSNPQKLYKIDVPNLTIDYPRGAILGFQPGVGVRRMAVVGDSFISGEGNAPFVPGTDTAGPPENRCHRSKNAYAFKLDYDPQVSANLTAFAACSGATSLNLHGAGQWNEPKQLDAVPPDTQVIVVSAGGNDTRLFQAIHNCSVTVDAQVCEAALAEVDDNVRASWFRDRIRNAFAAIRAKAPNAQVIVVGYPHIVGTVGEPHCGWLAHDITPLEVSLVDSIGVGINSVLQQEAALANFTYLSTVEAFRGHKVCDEVPFAHSVVPANPQYSYHPNAAGMTALYELLKSELA